MKVEISKNEAIHINWLLKNYGGVSSIHTSPAWLKVEELEKLMLKYEIMAEAFD